MLLLVQDNLEIACSAIEKAAMERAVVEVDDSFSNSYDARRRHREVSYSCLFQFHAEQSRKLRSGQAFWDPNAPTSNFSSSLPDPLRIRPNGLQSSQAGVYEDFGEMTQLVKSDRWHSEHYFLGTDQKRQMTSRPSSTLPFAQARLYAASPSNDGAHSRAYLTHQEAMERFGVNLPHVFMSSTNVLQVMTQDLEAVVVQLPIQSLAALPSNHDVRHLIRQILFTAAEAQDRQKTPLVMSQKIVQLLYKSSSQLGREVYVALLDQLCHAFEEVAKEALTWLQYAEDEVGLVHTATDMCSFAYSANTMSLSP